jgi:hypothetical protein
MEQGDATLITILRQIGCASWPEKIESVNDFESEHIFEACARVIASIHPGTAFSKGNVLPPQKAARFRACTNLSQAIEEMGFTGDLGYQSFLYPNVKDMRVLLMWIVDKLPKHDKGAGGDEETTEILGANAALNRDIVAALQGWSSATNVYDAHVNNGMVLEERHRLETVPVSVAPTSAASASSSSATAAYYQQYQAPLAQQLPPAHRHSLAPSVLEALQHELCQTAEADENMGGARWPDLVKKLVARAFKMQAAASAKAGGAFAGQSIAEMVASLMSAYKGGRSGFGLEDDDDDAGGAFARRAEFGQDDDEDEVDTAALEAEAEELRLQRAAELQELRDKLTTLRDEWNRMQRLGVEYAEEARLAEATLGDVAREKKKLVAEFKVKKATLDLMANAEENLVQLQELLAASSARLTDLGAEWETHRVPLVEQYRQVHATMAARKEEVADKIDMIRSMRAEMKAIARDIREKDELVKETEAELARVPETVGRQVFIRRIMDIVGNLDRQKVDIQSILIDIRTVQRDVNNVSETSKRSFALTDETIYSYAKKHNDATAIAAYKLVVDLKEGFNVIVNDVEETGKAKNEIRDLQQYIEACEARNTASNMERVAADLKQVKSENKALKARLKGDA